MSEELQQVKGGSVGAGSNALLTIITVATDSDKLNEETFRVPYVVVNQDTLKRLVDINMMRGYRIEKIDEGKSCPFHGEQDQ